MYNNFPTSSKLRTHSGVQLEGRKEDDIFCSVYTLIPYYVILNTEWGTLDRTALNDSLSP